MTTTKPSDEERWLPVAGFEGVYEVSDLGRVRSLDRLESMSSGRTRQRYGKLVRGTQDDYRIVHLRSRGCARNVRVHRLVLETFVGPCPDKHEGCHNDGNRTNNALSNLRWDTRSANMRDAVKHGTHPYASRSHCKRGHALKGANLIPAKLKNGQRECWSCAKAARWVKSRPGASVQDRADFLYDELTLGYPSHEGMILMAEYMADTGCTTQDMVEMIRKPWDFSDAYEQATLARGKTPAPRRTTSPQIPR